jgi:DNA ligase (NAD+)
METGEIVIYQNRNGDTQIEVKLEKESVWLHMKEIAKLFGRDKSVISRHISNVFKEKDG